MASALSTMTHVHMSKIQTYDTQLENLNSVETFLHDDLKYSDFKRSIILMYSAYYARVLHTIATVKSMKENLLFEEGV